MTKPQENTSNPLKGWLL